MNAVSFVEGKPYKKQEIEAIFRINGINSDEEISKIIDIISKKEIIKEYTNERDTDDDAEDSKYLSYFIFDDNGVYSFKVVGLLVINDILIKIYPKYFDKEINYEGNDPLINVVKTIKKYIVKKIKKRGRSKQNEFETFSNDVNSSSVLALMLELLDDYQQYGLYSTEVTTVELNSGDNINWNDTINLLDPIIQDDEPIYLDYYSNVSKINEDDFIRMLHASIIKDIYNKLIPLGLDEFFELTLSDYPNIETFDFLDVDKEYVSNMILKEKNIQFNTRKNALLDLMLSYAKNDGAGYSNGNIYLYTSSFNLVWEDVCKEVFNDIYETRKFDGRTLEEMMVKPHLSPLDTDLDKLIPDAITIHEDKFIIIDAKYYRPGKKGSKLPGLESITKQYLYNIAYLDFIRKNNYTACNYFVIPKNRDIEEDEWDIKYDLFKYLTQNIESGLFSDKIIIKFFEPNELYEAYLSNRIKLDLLIG